MCLATRKKFELMNNILPRKFEDLKNKNKFNTYFTSVVPTALLLQCNWPITGIRRVL